jgi:ATP-dependent RNA helicase DDX18/HAS1
MLFSATQTTKVADIARVSLNAPVYVGVEDKKISATVTNLEQVNPFYFHLQKGLCLR